MAEYISREAVMDAFAQRVKQSNNSDFAWPPTWNSAVSIVEQFPAADVVEVVRCKDCEHNYGTQKAPRCDFTEFRLTPNSYCSCGFRKMDISEDEDNG